MSHLHTLNNVELLQDCARFLSDGDALLLIEDGVYCVTQAELGQLPDSITVYCLQDDVDARGLGQLAQEHSQKIGFEGFVGLCCTHSKIINWF
ncbi:MAG: sulfurtransferase complex subunit TusB [Gammaproteobacteria bacterium]|nr:sulfurtransferase complex subunit TusB [Gammaproteobacteria bacterium]